MSRNTTPSVTPSSAQAPSKSTRGRATASPVKRGKTWDMRRRYKGHDLFVSGHKTAAAAQREMNEKVYQVDQLVKPFGAGPSKTTLAQALQDYAIERLPYMKGAPQEARRINAYLRPAGLRLLKVTKLERVADVAGKQGKGAHYAVELVAHTHERVIPNGLHAHRKALLTANANSDRRRAVLASTLMSDIARSDVQAFVKSMNDDKHSPSTVGLERAVLRALFNYARTQWNWVELRDNPATELKMVTVDNERTRVLSLREQTLLDEALNSCYNGMVAPTLTLLRETAMRASEPLQQARWRDVDWERRILTLSDSKSGKREVPLSPLAIEALQALQPGDPDERVVRISYEALRAAWRRACERAGIEDLRIHDLRHTAATRMALKSGNVFIVQALTGHKTFEMVARYVNVKASDVVDMMYTPKAGADEEEQTPAPVPTPAPEVQAEPAAPEQVAAESEAAEGTNVIQFPLRRRA